jgi:hypothetical protein
VNTYILTSLVCFALYLVINWYDKQELTLGDLVIFTLVSLFPVVNVVLLLYMSLTMIFPLDGDSPIILKGRK